MAGKITIFTSEAIPNGMAGSNRIISMAKGFISNGVLTEVISFYKYANPEFDTLNPSDGSFEGVKFRNVFNSQIKSPYYPIRLIHELIKPILVLLAGLKTVNRNTLIIYYAEKTWPAVALRILSLTKNAVFLREETEHPTLRTVNKRRIGTFLYLKFHYRLFDGLLVITKNLYDYFSMELNYRKPILLVPMIVDFDRFTRISDKASQSIIFSGELDDRKEGVTVLLKAFSLITSKYPELRLELFGAAPDKAQEAKFYHLVKSLGLGEKVVFHGYKSREQMTVALCDSRLFVFSRPQSLQAQFGFSTKLGEYLATGKPVIVSHVGEIDKYLTDGINAYFCVPDPESVALKINEIQENYSQALKIGEEGRKTAMRCFNNKLESYKIVEFVKTFFKKSIL